LIIATKITKAMITIAVESMVKSEAKAKISFIIVIIRLLAITLLAAAAVDFIKLKCLIVIV